MPLSARRETLTSAYVTMFVQALLYSSLGRFQALFLKKLKNLSRQSSLPHLYMSNTTRPNFHPPLRSGFAEVRQHLGGFSRRDPRGSLAGCPIIGPERRLSHDASPHHRVLHRLKLLPSCRRSGGRGQETARHRAAADQGHRWPFRGHLGRRPDFLQKASRPLSPSRGSSTHARGEVGLTH